MVIHDVDELPVEVAVIKKPLFEQIQTCENSSNIQQKNSKDRIKRKRKKSKTKDSSSASEVDEKTGTCNEISSEDLEELRTVYKKCKTVVHKIETKYGHLLGLNAEGPSKKRRNNTLNGELGTDSKCQCVLNKKIIFDEEGKEIAVNIETENHICHPKLPDLSTKSPEVKHVQVEYHHNEIELPTSLEELSKLLKNPDIEKTYRNQLVNQVRMIKQEHSNDIKFNKHSLIEKLKTNPDEILDFKGTNLFTLPGYS